MVKIYSHSKLSTFEQCPLKFKFRYIDGIISEIETIEAHLGTCVHKTLEWLYTKVKKQEIPKIDELIFYYSKLWEKNYNPKITIVKKEFDLKDYFNKGIQFIANYYTKNYPFDENTLEVEKKIKIKLDEQGEYEIQGFIDRLVYNPKTGEYEIHDYKTSNSLPSQEKINNDRQLALYAIAIKELFGKDKKVCLIWHYLAYGKKICSLRTNEQLEQLKKDTIFLINRIESTTEFPANKTSLCNWCEYKNICPEFGGILPKENLRSNLDEYKEKKKTY